MRLKKFDVALLPPQQDVARADCCLYVIQEGGEPYYKIGVAGHPTRRLSALQSGNRQKLSHVLAYLGTKKNCHYVENVALKFFKAPAASSWVWVDNLTEIREFLDAFCGDEA